MRTDSSDLPALEYVPTRFFSLSRLPDGQLALYNTLTGALGVVPAENGDAARAALKRSARHRAPLDGVLRELEKGGFLIPVGTDEAELLRSSYLKKFDETRLSLIVLPTEQCNFRCVYCYESFGRGAMPKDVQEGIKNFIRSQPQLRRIDLNWFGGEPLLASDVVVDMTKWLYAYCMEREIEYIGGITTNGSLLTEELAREIIPAGVRFFQITLDGLPADHDATRVSVVGAGTFQAVLDGLKVLKPLKYDFTVAIRHNFTAETAERTSSFVEMLKKEFGGDARFTTMFQAVGKWGGPNDRALNVCEGEAAVRAVISAKRAAVAAGFRNTFALEELRPGGFVCYAADPRAFVIGSDGAVYKCTVELDYHSRNVVGHLAPDGRMELDWRKMALWVETNGMRAGTKCSTCFFTPNCFGAICPKEWMDIGEVTCPPEKVAIREALALVVDEQTLPAPPEMRSVVECSRG